MPVRARWQLLAAKLLAAVMLLFAAFILADFIALAGALANAAISGPQVPEATSVGLIARDHLNGLAAVVAPTIYTIALATLLSVLTRSALAALLVSVAFITIEGLMPIATIFAHGYAPGLTRVLADALPFYHVANLKSWWQEGSPLLVPLGATASLSASLAISTVVAGVWTALFAGCAIWRFMRQDLD